MAKHPMQPLVKDNDGMVRFKQNAIVRWLLDAGPFDMNSIGALPNISVEDREQFAQLIGYSLSGFSELSYVTDATYARAEKYDSENDPTDGPGSSLHHALEKLRAALTDEDMAAIDDYLKGQS